MNDFLPILIRRSLLRDEQDNKMQTDQQQDIGLFTFYRQQQEQEEQLEKLSKKQRKDKPKSRNHKHHSKPESKHKSQKSNEKDLNKLNQSVESVGDCKSSKSSVKKKPIVELVSLSPLLRRAIPEEENEVDSPILVKKKVDHSQRVTRIRTQIPAYQESSASQVSTLREYHQKLMNTVTQHNMQKPLRRSEEIKEKDSKRMTLMEKLKHLEIQHKNVIVDSKDCIDHLSSNKNEDRKKNFDRLITDFYKNSKISDPTTLKLLRQTLKLPALDKQPAKKAKTEASESLVSLRRPLMPELDVKTPHRSLSSNKKELKAKKDPHFSKRYKNMKVVTEDSKYHEGRQLNKIELGVHHPSDLWNERKVMVIARLCASPVIKNKLKI